MREFRTFVQSSLWALTGIGKLQLRHLEFHVSHVCNLKCRFCSHYCDIGYSDKIDHDAALASLQEWSKRISPRIIRMLGGEPLIEKRLIEYIDACHTLFPKAKRDVVTNATLIDRWDDTLPQRLRDTGTTLHVSLHPIPDRMKPMQERSLQTLERWKKDFGIKVKLNNYTAADNWLSWYKGEGTEIRPYNNADPQTAKRICTAKHCTILHEGALWQCAQLAFLPLVADKLSHRPEWEPYLAYKPLTLSASRQELARFVSGQYAVDFCRMCPVDTDHGADASPA